MASPIPIGDAIELCKSIISIYRFCRNAPTEMKSAVEKVDYVATILDEIQSPRRQISYLASDDGQRLNRLLKTELTRLQRSLKKLKLIVLKWEKSWPIIYKRVLFLAFTLPNVPDLKASLEARMTGIDRILNIANISRGKLDPTQFNALAAALQPLTPRKQSNGKDDFERKAVKEALKATGVAKTNSPQLSGAKKAYLLQTLTESGVSRAKSELVTHLYEQESERAPALKAPIIQEKVVPIHKKEALPLELVKPKRPRGCSCEILVVDSRNGHRSLITHAYLEYYRAWVANNHGDWLFHRVDSAGLGIETPFRVSDAGKLDMDTEPLKQPGREPDQVVLDAIAGGDEFFRTDDRPYEKASIIERIQAHQGRGLNKGFGSRYDYILTFEPHFATALEQLQQRAQSSSGEGSTGKGTKKSLRIVLLPGTTAAVGTVAKDYVLPIGKALAEFLTAEFGYERPEHSIARGGLRTSFMQVSWPAQMRRVEKEIERIERQSGCKVHLAAESARNGWVVAIVGLKERLGEAEEMVTQLRDSDGQRA